MATYTIPPGLTFKQKKAMAALLACRPCCGAGGSGSGSGSGISGNDPLCCGCADYPDQITITFDIACGYTISVVCNREPFPNYSPSCENVGVPNLTYSGSEISTGVSASYDLINCSNLTTPGAITDVIYYAQCSLSCVPCNNTGGHIWYLTASILMYISGEQREVTLSLPMRIISCAPVVWEQVIETVTCYESTPGSPYACCSNGQFVQCQPAWSYSAACDGTLVTVDASE